MRKAGTLAAIAAIASQLWASSALAACPVTKTHSVADGKIVREVRATRDFVVYRSRLRVNTDGAANSYHPIGKSEGALNTLCNGIAVYPSSGPYKGVRISSIAPKTLTSDERCQIIQNIFRESRDAGYAVPKSGTISWYALAMEPGPAPKGFYRPCIQTEGAFAGFFVAQTSKSGDPSKSVCDPAHWLSSTQIPYLTLPTGSRAFRDAGVRVGDLALVHRRVAGADTWVAAIVADSGNSGELGEGSIALHHALGNPTVTRIPNNLPADVTTFIFKKSEPKGAITADTLIAAKDWLISKAGGAPALADCLP